MIARGFKPVVWVAAVGAAALGCYMLSLRVASERADLTSLQHRIVATQQQIRALQTEVGTRGRLAQLEQWNDEVLALAPPASGQYVEGAQLARFETHDAPPLDNGAQVQLASAEAAPAPLPPAAAPATPAPQHAVAAAPALAPAPLHPATVQRASLNIAPPQAAPAPLPARPAPPPSHQAAPVHRAAVPVRTASATPVQPPAPRQAPPPARIRTASPPPAPRAATPPARIRTASSAEAPRAAPARHGLLDARTLREIGTAARAERGGGTRD